MEEITVLTCAECGHRMRAPSDYAGRRAKCLHCGKEAKMLSMDEALAKQSAIDKEKLAAAEAKRAASAPVQSLECKMCGGTMRKIDKSRNGLAILVFVMGVIIGAACFPAGLLVAAVFVAVAVIIDLGFRGKAWRCQKCGVEIKCS